MAELFGMRRAVPFHGAGALAAVFAAANGIEGESNTLTRTPRRPT